MRMKLVCLVNGENLPSLVLTGQMKLETSSSLRKHSISPQAGAGKKNGSRNPSSASPLTQMKVWMSGLRTSLNTRTGTPWDTGQRRQNPIGLT